MAISVFIVKVPGAEALVGQLRQRFDASARLGVPAHITVLVPFMDPKAIDAAVLEQARRALAPFSAFSFALRAVGRFPATAYLVPEPSAPFVQLTRAVVQAFPAFPPYAGEHDGMIPHLTVAHGSPADADEAEAALRVALEKTGGVRARCEAVTLIENSSGVWQTLAEFQLG